MGLYWSTFHVGTKQYEDLRAAQDFTLAFSMLLDRHSPWPENAGDAAESSAKIHGGLASKLADGHQAALRERCCNSLLMKQ